VAQQSVVAARDEPGRVETAPLRGSRRRWLREIANSWRQGKGFRAISRSSGKGQSGPRSACGCRKSAPLLEIDRERNIATKLQKEMDEATRRSDRKDADHCGAFKKMQAQLGDVRHQTGVLLGRLDAVQAENMRLQAEMLTLREAETRARETRTSVASAGIRKTPRPTRSSRAVPTAKPATRRRKSE
jgi:hypothetical protein